MRVTRVTDVRDLRSGFSLLEVLVSIAVLSLLVLAIAEIYNQSASAWEDVVDDTEVVSACRALANVMANEISQSVFYDADNPQFTFDLSPAEGAASVTFVLLVTGGDYTNYATRAAHRVRYDWDQIGSVDGTVERTVWVLNSENYSDSPGWDEISSLVIASNVTSVSLSAYEAEHTAWGGTGLPAYVEIDVQMLGEADLRKAQLDPTFPIAKKVMASQTRAYLSNRRRYF